MSNRIHDHEADTSITVVRSLIEEQCPQWAGLPPRQLLTSGTDNAMWRLSPSTGPDLVVRLPRTDGAAASLTKELDLLPRLAGRLPVDTPTIAYAGRPSSLFAHPWAVVEWIDGVDGWAARDALAGPREQELLATDLAAVVDATKAITDVDAPTRVPGTRGGPLLPLLERLEGWLEGTAREHSRLVDAAAIRRSAAESAEAAGVEVVLDQFVHGDLIPGNVLVDGVTLCAVIDWGGAGLGDAALDLVPAWAILDRGGREVFREATGATPAAWLRGRAFALEQAVGGVLYYVPRGHPLGDVMRRSLAWVLED